MFTFASYSWTVRLYKLFQLQLLIVLPALIDIKECNGNHDCHEYAVCDDTLGSFICTCKEGFSGNGTYCEGLSYIKGKWQYIFLSIKSLT